MSRSKSRPSASKSAPPAPKPTVAPAPQPSAGRRVWLVGAVVVACAAAGYGGAMLLADSGG